MKSRKSAIKTDLFTRITTRCQQRVSGKCIWTLGQARADFALTMMAVTYNIKRLAFLDTDTILGW